MERQSLRNERKEERELAGVGGACDVREREMGRGEERAASE